MYTYQFPICAGSTIAYPLCVFPHLYVQFSLAFICRVLKKHAWLNPGGMTLVHNNLSWNPPSKDPVLSLCVTEDKIRINPSLSRFIKGDKEL